MEKPQMISIAGLKARGWTQALITLLGEPDVVGRNSHYAKLAPMRLYDTARVASFEVSSEFLAAKAKAARRQCGAKTAVETKRAALMQQVLEMHSRAPPMSHPSPHYARLREWPDILASSKVRASSPPTLPLIPVMAYILFPPMSVSGREVLRPDRGRDAHNWNLACSGVRRADRVDRSHLVKPASVKTRGSRMI